MHRLNMKISLFKLLLILDIMKELYLTTMNSDGGVYYIKINDVSGKVDTAEWTGLAMYLVLIGYFAWHTLRAKKEE